MQDEAMRGEAEAAAPRLGLAPALVDDLWPGTEVAPRDVAWLNPAEEGAQHGA